MKYETNAPLMVV